jgi:hypothetical protein
LKDQKYVGHIILAGDETAGPVQVRLVLGNGATVTQTIKKVSADYNPIHLNSPRRRHLTTRALKL